MKLRFRENSLRLRVNQPEVKALAAGQELKHQVEFPGNSYFSYVLCPTNGSAAVRFRDGVLTVEAPKNTVRHWSSSEEIGMYFDLLTDGTRLRVAIEKDLECVDGPAEERDPNAFPRGGKTC